MKKFLSMFLVVVMIAAAFPGIAMRAEAMTGDQIIAMLSSIATGDHIKAQITATYEAAKSRSGKSSFNGLCGTYVNWQLVILGINTSYISGNGKDEFDNYKDKSTSSGGYSIAAYPASGYTVLSALNAITENGTKDAYNILLGFEKTTIGEGATYGHTCFIHAVLNGNVYYSESSSWTIDGSRVSEGTPIVQSISNFANLYRSSVYTFDGAIHFGGTAPQVPDYENVAAGTYYLRNKSTKTYFSAEGTANKSNISVAALTSADTQKFVFSGGASNYVTASFDSSLAVNPFSNTLSEGTNINLYNGAEIGNDMHWGFEAVSGGYIIHNISYPNLVLGLDGTNVRLETNTGADDQIWELISENYSAPEADTVITTHAGSTFTVDVKTSVHTTKNGLGLSLSYDKALLEYVSGEWKIGDTEIASFSNEDKLLGVAATEEKKNVGGVVCSVTFRVKDGVSPCDTTISGSVQFSPGDETEYVTPALVMIKDYVAGDLNGDEDVTADDAIYLLYHVFFAESYPVTQPVDFNGDGDVSADDAIYLLYHVFFASAYPI